jgi:uncharacterized membrane protein
VADFAEELDRLLRFMETHNGQRLAICVYSVLATFVLLLYPGTAVALVFGIPYLFFVPGFALVRLVFWRNTSLEAKFVLSLGLSILVVILLGLVLVLTPIGLKVVAAMLGTALVVSAISLGLIITAEYPSTTYYAITDEFGSANIETTYLTGGNVTLVVEMHNGEDGPRLFSLHAYGMNNTTTFGERWFNTTLDEGETTNVTMMFALNTTGVFRIVFPLYIQEEGHEPYLYSESPVQLWIQVIDE